jgi:hypothetical protein
MSTNGQSTGIRVTVDEIGPDQDNRLLATLVTDREEILTVPFALLPQGTRTGDVLTLSFTPEPDEREHRRRRIAELQRRLFGPG